MPRSDHDLALNTLCLVLATQPEITEHAERIAFLRACPHEGLAEWYPKMLCQQPYKPRATLCEQAGLKLEERIEGEFDLVLLMPERQKDQTLADLARGFDLLKPGGILCVALHNDWGAKRFEKSVLSVAGGLDVVCKSHCRVFWSRKTDKLKTQVLNEWRGAADLRRGVNDEFWTKPGLFSWNRVDDGSALLVEQLPVDLAGVVADLGAGWGYLSHQILSRCPEVTTLDAYEADRDAVEAARRNVGNVKARARTRVHWHDVTAGIEPRRYDVIVTNPPFHEGREPDPEIGMKFISAAACGLKPFGHLWLVANRHLPYEALLEEAFDSVVKVTEERGYKVLRAGAPRHDLFFQKPRFKRGRR